MPNTISAEFTNVIGSDTQLNQYPAVRQGIYIHLLPTGADVYTGEANIKNMAYSTFRTMLMNASAAKILTLCDGNRSIADLIQHLAEHYEDDSQKVAKLILSFLPQATEQGLLDVHQHSYPTNINVTGSSDYYMPLHMMIELTAFCNLNCRHCYRDSGPNRRIEIPTDQLLSILQRLSDSGVRVLELTGGEPMARRDFFKIWDFCGEHFSLVALLTNGTLIDEAAAERLSKYADKVMVQIDLDGSTAETHEHLRGMGTFERAKQAIRNLSKHGLQVRAAMSVARQSIHDIENTLLLAKKLGAAWFVHTPILDIGRGRDPDILFTLDQMEEWARLANRLGDVYEDFIPRVPEESIKERVRLLGNCGAGYRSGVLGPTGKFRPCPLMNDGIMTIGDLRVEDMHTVFGRPLVTYMRELRWPGPETCTGCHFEFYCKNCHVKAINIQSMVKKMGMTCKWAEKFNLREWVDIEKISGDDSDPRCPAHHDFALSGYV